MICMCEVGEATKPLTEEQMQQVSDTIMHAWNGAATEHFELRSMFQAGAPHMTICKDGAIQCSRRRILENIQCRESTTYGANLSMPWPR